MLAIHQRGQRGHSEGSWAGERCPGLWLEITGIIKIRIMSLEMSRMNNKWLRILYRKVRSSLPHFHVNWVIHYPLFDPDYMEWNHIHSHISPSIIYLASIYWHIVCLSVSLSTWLKVHLCFFLSQYHCTCVGVLALTMTSGMVGVRIEGS